MDRVQNDLERIPRLPPALEDVLVDGREDVPLVSQVQDQFLDVCRIQAKVYARREAVGILEPLIRVAGRLQVHLSLACLLFVGLRRRLRCFAALRAGSGV